MAFGKKRAKGQLPNKSQYEKDLEEKGPNLASYEDDPLLNMEPVFSDDLSGQAANQTIQSSYGGGNTDPSNPLSSIISKHREKNPKNEEEVKRVSGPLGDIIGNARKKSEEIAHDVEERDPVIAKLKKIEQLLRSGGSDASLYTDVNKSQVGYYAERAKTFFQEQVTRTPENDGERIARIARETKDRKPNDYVSNHQDLTSEIQNRVILSREKNKIDNIESEVHRKSREIMENSRNILKNNNIKTFDMKDSLFSVDAINRQNEINDEQNKNNVNVSKIADDFKNKKMTEAKIIELEEKIKKKIEKVQKHKASLAKKEEQVMKLLVENDAKKSSPKLAEILEARSKELEQEAEKLQEHERFLEKTIADLKTMELESDSRKPIKKRIGSKNPFSGSKEAKNNKKNVKSK